APDTTVVECGKDISIPKVDDSPPLPMLKVGDIINVGGFEARVVEVEGANGTFSGKCVVNVKTFGGVRILSEFENISVNESHQVTAGVINSVKGELNIIGLDEIIKEVVDVFDNTETDPNVGDPYQPGDPVTIVIDGQTVTVSGDTTFTTPDGTEVIVTLSGQPPIVTVDGEPTEVTTDKLDFDNPNTVTGNELASNVTDTSAHAIKLVTFKPVKKQLFGFDQYPEDIPQFWADYKKEKVNKKDYPVNWKSNQSFGLPDQVIMEITTDNPDSIKTRLSIESSVVGPLSYSFNPEDSTWVIQLNGQSHENEDRITAFYTQDDGSKIAVGHLDMVSYNKQDVKLVIVPVGDKYGFDKNPNYTELKDSLNAIYKGAITFWDVSITDPLEADYEENDTKGLDTELPDMAAYTKEMRNLRSALKDRSDYNKDAYYIFLVDKSEKGDKNGIMPFRRHFGFIFMDDNGKLKDNKEKLFHTIAHELGHGAFGLEHVWQEKGTSQGATYNLMDYTSKKPDNLLRKYQWYYIHNPKSSWFGGDEESTSDYVANNFFKNTHIKANIDDTYTFITPAGEYITLPPNVFDVKFNFGIPNNNQESTIIPGTIRGFSFFATDTMGIPIVDHGAFVKMEYNQKISNSALLGYYTEGGDSYTNYISTANGHIRDRVIMALPGYKRVNVYSFKAEGLKHHNYTTTPPPLMNYFQFPIRDFRVDSKKDELVVFENNKVIGVDQKAFKQEVLDIIYKPEKDIYKTEYLIILAKLAELGCAYPRLFEEYVSPELIGNTNGKCEKEYNEFMALKDPILNKLVEKHCICEENHIALSPISCSGENDENPYPKGEEYLLEIYHTILELINNETKNFEQFIEEYNSGNDKIFNTCLKFDLMTGINSINSDYIKNELNAGIILRIISRLVNEPTFESEDRRADAEGAIIKLLKYSNTCEYRQILEGIEGQNLYSPSKFLFEQLFESVNDETVFIGENNRGKLIGILTKMAMDDIDFYEERLKLLHENLGKRVFILEHINIYKAAGKSLLYHIADEKIVGKYLSDNYSTYDINYDWLTETKQIEVQLIKEYGWYDIAANPSVKLRPFDLVQFVNRSNLSLVKDLLKNPQFTDVPLPAIVLAYSSKAASNETINQSISAVIDIASLAASGGSLAAIKGLTTFNKIRQALLIADVASSGLSIAATTIADSEKNDKIRNVLNTLSAVTGFISMTDIAIVKAEKIFSKRLDLASGLVIESRKIPEKEAVERMLDAFKDLKDSELEEFLKTHQFESEASVLIISSYINDGRDVKNAVKLEDAKAVFGRLSKAAQKITNELANSISWNDFDEAFKAIIENNEIRKGIWDSPFKTDFLSFFYRQGKVVNIPKGDFEFVLKSVGGKLDEALDLYRSAENSTTALNQVDDIIDACDDVISTPKAIDYLNSYGCFVAGTKISLNNQFIPIENVKVNDKAWTCDTRSKEKTLQIVTKTFVRETDTLVYVWLNKELIQTTAEHPFFTPGLWKPALSLKEGDEVLNYKGLWVKVDSIAVKDTTCTVYNFEVEGNHNYYVGTTGVLVHNTCSQTDYFKKLGFEGESLTAVQDLFKNSDFRKIYDQFGATLKEQFLTDFKGAAESLKIFEGKPGFVDSWRAVKDLPEAFRSNTKNLEKLSNALKQEGYDIAYFENLLKSKTDPQK
ncbi:MAG: polymorphic toxin-type HINT domain-containing protein, partial [Bacteroidales bacterium]|nr:polymorphic toxin-type HINT domain-containing protein [Bacteroidales bacterium]